MDVAAALQHADGDSARLGQCGAIFLREGPRLMEDLVRALQQGNPAAVRRHAHQLKRSAAALNSSFLTGDDAKSCCISACSGRRIVT